MRRIRLVVVLVLCLTLAPLATEAQKAPQKMTIGVLCVGWCPFPAGSEAYRPLIRALEQAGLVSGRTLAWDIGSIVNSEAQLAVEAQKLVVRRPDLILVWPGNIAAARAAKDATRTIPIVLLAVSDAVENGLVDSLSHPGGNITGTSVPLFDLTIKQLQILKEINPRLKRIVVVQGHLDPSERMTVDRLREAARSLGLDADGVNVVDATNMEQGLSTAQHGATTIVAIVGMGYPVQARMRVLALERKLPLILPWRMGGAETLLSYGPHFPSVAERTAVLIDRILKGTTPANLPMEEPARYELVIDVVMAGAHDPAICAAAGGPCYRVAPCSTHVASFSALLALAISARIGPVMISTIAGRRAARTFPCGYCGTRAPAG